MKGKIKITSTIETYSDTETLNKADRVLIDMAKVAAKKAYAPYSHFKVGAAVLLKNGEIIVGNNQENAVYPAGLCAERVALFYASSKFPKQAITSLAIISFHQPKKPGRPITPCGACRQAILEYELRFGKDVRILMSSESGETYVCKSIKELLPLAFNKTDLV